MLGRARQNGRKRTRAASHICLGEVCMPLLPHAGGTPFCDVRPLKVACIQVDQLPLSRPKKNIHRDFADAGEPSSVN